MLCDQTPKVDTNADAKRWSVSAWCWSVSAVGRWVLARLVVWLAAVRWGVALAGFVGVAAAPVGAAVWPGTATAEAAAASGAAPGEAAAGDRPSRSRGSASLGSLAARRRRGRLRRPCRRGRSRECSPRW